MLDDLIAKGDLHVIRNNRSHYVVLSKVRHQELIAAEEEAYYARIRTSLRDLKSGKVKTFKTVEDLVEALNADETE